MNDRRHKSPLRHSFMALAASCLLGASSMPAVAAPATWSLLFDRAVTGGERSLRGLALSHDETSLYGGYIQSSSSAGVRHYTLAGDPPVATAQAFYNVTSSANGSSSADHQPKAIATDSRGLVFIGSSKDSTSGDNARVIVQDSTLGAGTRVIALADIEAPGSVTSERVGGLDVREVGGTIYLYASRESGGSAWIERYIVGGSDVASTTLTLDSSFNGSGRFSLRTVFAGASNLRGIEVDADGNIFVTSAADNALYRVSADLSTVTSQTVANAYDVALFDGRAFVTSYASDDSAIVELLGDASLALRGSFDAFGTFARDAVVGARAGTGYSGIEIDSQGRILLVDQLYACGASNCGSGSLMADRVLISSALALMGSGTVPVPATLALVLAGLAAVAGTRPRR